MAADHYMLTVLGRDPKSVCYELDWRKAEAQLAPLALIDLLRETEKPHCVVALCTPEARRESLPLLEEGLRGRCKVEAIDVPSDSEDLKTYLSCAASAIPKDPEIGLTVDITHGYRHLSFLTYLAVLYLVALRGIRLRGAYYGLLREDAAVSRFLDLRPLVALPNWFHALNVLRETGSALPMAALLQEDRNPFAHDVARELSQISESHLSGLPLELGRQARLFYDQRLKPLTRLLGEDHDLPLAAEMVERLKEILEPFALAEEVTGDGWKGQVTLSRAELERQAGIIDDLLRRKSVATALGLLREWTVSWVSWRFGSQRGWLEKRARRDAERLLGAMVAVARDPDLNHLLSEEQRKVGEFWDELRGLRNAYHHHGMRAQVLVGCQVSEKLQRVRRYWDTVLRSCPAISLTFDGSRRGRLLVSPIGKRPGVLFSALHACRADRQDAPASCLVICSEETEELIAEASTQARYGGAIERLRLEDPVGGRSEIERLVKAARPHLLGADEVLVNITGGTTLMGLVAEAVAEAARKLARPVRRFGLIDRRPPALQDADPFQRGEPFWLDSAEDGDGNHD